MFCGNCGSRLPDDALFCANCGTKTAPEQSVPVAETPVQPESAAETPAQPAPVAETPVQPEPDDDTIELQSAYEEKTIILQPESVAETPVQPAAPAPAPVQQTAQPAPAPIPAPVQQPIPAPMPAPMPMPEPAPVKKKKSKAGLIVGLSAAAVVIGGAAVGYFGFHSDISRLIMGDEAYAVKLEKDSYAEFLSSENSDKFDDYLVESLSKVGEIKDMSENADSAPSASIDSAPLLAGAFDTTARQIADAISGADGVTIDSSIGISLGDDLSAIIGDAIKLPDKISTRIEAAGGDVNKLGGYLLDNSGNVSGGVEIYTDGENAVITLPEISDIKFKSPIQLPEAKAEVPKPDKAEITRIRRGLLDIYFDTVGKGELKFYNSELSGGGYTLGECRTSEVVISGEALRDMLDEMREYLKDDEYLREYIISTGVSSEDYKKIFEKKDDEKSKDIKGSLTIRNFYDVHNKILGKECIINSVTISAGSDGKEVDGRVDAVGFTAEDGIDVISIVVDNDISTSETNGTIIITREGDDANGVYHIKASDMIPDSKDTLSINVEYNDVAESEFMGQKIQTGSMKIYFAADNEFSFESLNKKDGNMGAGLMMNVMPSDDQITGMIARALDRLSISFTSKVENGAYATFASIALGELGSLDFDISLKPITEKPVMPGMTDAVSVDDVDSFTGKKLTVDLLNWLNKAKDTNPVVNTVMSLLSGAGVDLNDAIGDARQELDYYKNYSAYDGYSTEMAADEAARDVYNAVSDGISELDPENALSGIATVYYDKDGKREVVNAGPFDKSALEKALDRYSGEAKSLFVEITYDSAFVNKLGVTAVFTDDRNNIPSRRPDMLAFAAEYMESADGAEEPFAMGTYPELSEYYASVNVDYSDIDSAIAKLNDYAAATVPEVSTAGVKNSGKRLKGEFDQAVLALSNEGGEWRAVAARAGFDNTSVREFEVDMVFEPDFVKDIEEGFNSNTKLKNADMCGIQIMYYNGQFVGAEAAFYEYQLSFSDSSMPGAKDFADNAFKGWSGRTYLVNDVREGYILPSYSNDIAPLGTYSLKANGPLPAAVVADTGGMDGNWYVAEINGFDVTVFYAMTGSDYEDYEDELFVTVDGMILRSSDGEEISMFERDGRIFAPVGDYDEAEIIYDAGSGTLTLIEQSSQMTVVLTREKPDITAYENITFNDLVGEWVYYGETEGLSSFYLDDEDIKMLNSNFVLTINPDGTATTSADGYPETKYEAVYESMALILTADDSRYPSMTMLYDPKNGVLTDINTMISFVRK